MRFLIIVCSLMLSLGSWAQQGYEIKVKLEGYSEPQLFLANHYGDKQYIKDTVDVLPDGSFLFKREEALPGGVYLVVMSPNNDFIQIFIDKDQHFSFTTKIENTAKFIKFEGSKLNEDFYKYLNYLGDQRPLANKYGEELKVAKEANDEAKIKEVTAKLDGINEAVGDYQKKVMAEQPNTLLGRIIQSSIPVPTPDFSDSENPDFDRWIYAKTHWFDNIDLADKRFLRAPIMFEKIDYYIEKMTPQHPDSLSKSIDLILAKTKPAEESFKFYLIYFLNKYAASKVVGMDAVYVHLGEKYYKGGEAPWTEEEQLQKIVENAERLKPLLIGKVAPNIAIQEIDLDKTIQAKDNENEHKRYAVKRNFTLHDVDAEYTILFIWDPECGHCKKSMPDIIKFYDDFKSKGVEIVALCNQTYKDIPKCAETIIEKGMIKWINAIDPFIKSRYKQLYDVRSTPQIYLLNKNKEIISKRIGAEQLEEVMNQIIKMDAEKLQLKSNP